MSISKTQHFHTTKLFRTIVSITALTLTFAQNTHAQSCADLDGASVFSSEDRPLYLGFFGNDFARDSINNDFGDFGSEFSSTSVRNSFGNYGNDFSSVSANNNFATRPPKIVKNGKHLAYLSTNQFLDWTSFSLAIIDQSCTFFASRASPQFEKGLLGLGWGGVDASLIGTWWNPDRDGEGLVVDFYTGPGIIVYFYTYDLENNPMYLVGATEIPINSAAPIVLEVVRTRGTSFGSGFDKNSVIREAWGTLTIEFINCGQARMDWNPVMPGYEKGGTDLERLVPPAAGITCP